MVKRLKHYFDDFKKNPNIKTATELRDAALLREKIIRDVYNRLIAMDKIELGSEIVDELINKVSAIAGLMKRVVAGKTDIKKEIPLIEKLVNEYMENKKHIHKELKEDAKDICQKEFYNLLILEEKAA